MTEQQETPVQVVKTAQMELLVVMGLLALLVLLARLVSRVLLVPKERQDPKAWPGKTDRTEPPVL